MGDELPPGPVDGFNRSNTNRYYLDDKTDYHFNIDGKARFPNVPNVEYNLPIAAQVRAPQQIMMSLVHDVNKQWSVMGDLGWQDWRPVW